ncbi:MAG: hypothetical protein WC517_02935 [Patescibacteria group bacterium]
MDFGNCEAQNAGCRSYATDYNYQSKTWNGDAIFAVDNVENAYRFSEFLNSGEVKVTFDSGWRVAEGRTISNNRRLALGTVCNRANCEKIKTDGVGSCVFNETGKYCVLDLATKCTVPAGGVSCYVDNCYDGANELNLFNAGFETQETGLNAGNAKFWTDELSYSNINNRHYRLAAAGENSYGLRAVSANNSAELITTLPAIPLEAGRNYKLKFSIKGSIGQGSIVVAMTAGDSPYNVPNSSTALGGQAFVRTIGNWTNVEVPIINSAGFATGTIVIVTPIGSITDVALDNFSLQKFKSDCVASGIKLFSPLTEPSLTEPSNIYFDRDAQSCSSAAMGCSQFIRTKADLGNNLLYNGGLEYGLSGWAGQISPLPTINQGAAVLAANNYTGSYTVEIEPNSYYSFGFDAAQTASDASTQVTSTIKTLNTINAATLVPVGFTLESNCSIKTGNTVGLSNSPAGQYFERQSCYFKAPIDAHYLKFDFNASGDIQIDNLKIEKVSYPNFSATTYSVYDPSFNHEDGQIAYLKQAPDYYSCYKNEGGAWPTTAFELNNIVAKRAPECNSFAQVCLPSEVGCERYTPINGDPEVPGIIDGLDLCPSECSGYQVYQQEATNFIASSAFKQFIADNNAKYCSAAYAGCDEFTNLDEVGRGAESKEYYVSFKACQRPSADDASYYTWEGSDITGYQLKSFTLKKSNTIDPENAVFPATTGNGYAPCTNLKYYTSGTLPAGKNYGDNFCDDPKISITTEPAEFGICAKADMPGNSDCRELYDVNGNIHYRLLSRTITVSDNCHPYRRTQTQTTAAAAETDCQGTQGWWKTSGGSGECIYMAIPQEGKVCSATVAGCRAYTGNRGNNVRNILSSSDFASATTSDNLWVDGNYNVATGNNGKSGLMISSEATYPGGNSLTNKPGNLKIQHPVALVKNRTYTLSFWAKGDQSFNDLEVAFTGSGDNKFAARRLAGENFIAPAIEITTEWQRYDLGPVFFTNEPTVDDYLIFTLPSGRKIYLDNIILKELSNNIYAIENSWLTPISCDNKLNDANGKKAEQDGICQDTLTMRCSVGEMLGCTAYRDRAKSVWYLRSFNSLCRSEAAGCEALISTNNSESALAESFNTAAPDYDDVNIEADKLVYLVNDQKNSCSADNKGCSAFGLPIVDKWDMITGYQTVFLKNNPARYATDLCKHNGLWCEEYASSNNSLAYFKEPHGKTCDYAAGKGWVKTGTNDPCVPDGILGAKDGGSPNMSFGTGYEPASEKIQPIGPYTDVLGNNNKVEEYSGWTGNCPQVQAGCSEYIDTYPLIYTNLLSAADLKLTNKEISLQPFVLYNVENATMNEITGNSLSCQIFRPFGNSSPLYYASNTANCLVDITGINDKSKISKAGVYYALSNSVNNSSCNGNVDFKSGCILMNSRNNIDYNRTSTVDRMISYLTYDSAATYDLNNPANGNLSDPVSPKIPAAGGQGDTNVIVKAGANRTCNKWLECTTYQKTDDSNQDYRFDNQDQCLNFGICDYRNTDGSCGRYVTADYKDVTADNFSPNLTGYALPNKLPVAAMDQFGNSASVPNGNFESVMARGNEPLGWVMNASSSDLNDDGWKSYKYAVESRAQNLKFDLGYLSVNSVYAVHSEPIDVQKGYYALNLWVNTRDLKPETAVARIFINSDKISRVPIGGNISIAEDATAKSVKIDGENWLTSDSLRVKAGLPWTEITLLIKVESDDTVRIKLMNFDDETKLTNGLNLDEVDSSFNYNKCYDLESASDKPLLGKPDFLTACNLTGASLFDGVSLRAVLRVNNGLGEPLIPQSSNIPAAGELIARTCRAYPAQDARSCQYLANNQFYYGWYGYCLMADPDNPGQCLQWYPIDQLKGDVVDEYSGGYGDQIPLFYCAETKKIDTKATAKGSKTKFGVGMVENALVKLTGLQGLFDGLGLGGSEVSSDSFSLDNPETVRLFRYPIIQSIKVNGRAIVAGIMYRSMYPTVGLALFNGQISKGVDCTIPGIVTSMIVLNTELSCSPIGAMVTTINEFLDKFEDIRGGGTDSEGIFGSLFSGTGGRLIDLITGLLTNGDGNEPFSPRSSGIIEGIVDGFRSFIPNTELKENEWPGSAKIFAFVVSLGQIAIDIPISVPWSMIEKTVMDGSGGVGDMVNMIGHGAGLSGIGAEGSAAGFKVIADGDPKYAGQFSDPEPTISGDILGMVWGAELGSLSGIINAKFNLTGNYIVYYCSKVVQVVTATGQNKAWVNRVSRASQFSFLDEDRSESFPTNPYFFSNDNPDPDLNLAKLGYQFNGYNADYKPFGAIVTPSADSQNPYLWTSYINEAAINEARHPLFWEPPILSQPAPHQPRMGQPESPSGLQNLFAKAYAVWTWKPDSADNPTLGGVYEPVKSNSADYTDFIWDTPKCYCAGGNSTTNEETKDCAAEYNAATSIDWVSNTYRNNGFVRDMNDRDHYCLIKPEIITMSVNNSTNLVGDNSLTSSKPARLDFTVRIDRDQLPLTSYLVEWGDGELNNTSVTGVKLRARANPENPFTLYHLYSYEKVRGEVEAADCLNRIDFVDNPGNADPAPNCYLHYCNSVGECFVRIKVTVIDNWRAKGSQTTEFKIQVK